MLDLDAIRQLPKVALHDHLDGGPRPETVVELAAEVGHALPTTDAEELGRWFYEAADSGSLVRYLETFDHTVAVMQTAEGLRRVAKEFVLDQAADGVIYAEARWAPEQHLAGGLSLDDTVEAVRDGLADGMAEARSLPGVGRHIEARQLLTGMRHTDNSRAIAELLVRHRDDLAVGFDIAGGEAGNPPARHLAAFRYLREHNMPYTIHAGEAAGVESIHEAVQTCGALRLGHGVRIVDDIQQADGEPVIGDFAAFIRDRQVPLELCVTSNLQTGVANTVAEHPIDLLYRLGFAVTVNCDNRLMSGTTMSREFSLLVEHFGWTADDITRVTETALDEAFVDLPTRERLRSITTDSW